MEPPKLGSSSSRGGYAEGWRLLTDAGIITGEVVLGTFLLLCSGIVHRRYRWRQERSWVLFDWHVVNDAPPKPYFKFGVRLGWGSKTNVRAPPSPQIWLPVFCAGISSVSCRMRTNRAELDIFVL